PGQARNRQLEVDAVQERTRKSLPVELEPVRETTTGSAWIALEPARARVRGSDQAEPRGELHSSHRPRHHHPPVFQRLAQALDRIPPELGDLVEEQDSVVR